jgi:hypothetical protein
LNIRRLALSVRRAEHEPDGNHHQQQHQHAGGRQQHLFQPASGCEKGSLKLIRMIEDIAFRSCGYSQSGGHRCRTDIRSHPADDGPSKNRPAGYYRRPGIVLMGMKSGKKVIGAGAGNPPCIVDETADLVKAAEDIINGASFDYNLPCIAEKSLIVVECRRPPDATDAGIWRAAHYRCRYR